MENIITIEFNDFRGSEIIALSFHGFSMVEIASISNYFAGWNTEKILTYGQDEYHTRLSEPSISLNYLQCSLKIRRPMRDSNPRPSD